MATIIENMGGRRIIRVSTDDVISLIKEYQATACGCHSYEEIRSKLNRRELFIPEDM